MFRGIAMTKDERVYLRMETKLKELLEEQARKENRTLSNYMENVLINDLRKRGVKYECSN